MFTYEQIEKFFEKVNKTDGCWLWTGGKTKAGYGMTHINGKQYISSRASYIIHKGEIPEGLWICHHCDNPSCVNPDHIYAGSPKQNFTDMSIRERSWKTKLTVEQVKEIYSNRENGVMHKVIAKVYGVSRNTISGILNGWTWTSVTGLKRKGNNSPVSDKILKNLKEKNINGYN